MRRLARGCALWLIFIVAFTTSRGYAADPPDQVTGNLIQFNDNGSWCWFQDERIVIDNSTGKIILGSIACGNALGGVPRDGDIEALIYNSQTAGILRGKLLEGNVFGCDDHNMPAFLIRPDGKILTIYAGHHDDYYSYYRIAENDVWGIQNRFNWQTIPGGCDFPATYSNLFYLSVEDRIYNFSRTDNRSPNMMISNDWGETWSYGGRLCQTDDLIGYVNGYFKYSGNGTDRIDFLATEHHPRDYNTSIYHGYIKAGHSYDSYGNMIDTVITDKIAPFPADFTPVIKADTVFNGDTLSRFWEVDLRCYPDLTIAAILQARLNDDPLNPSADPEHVYLYARLSDGTWNIEYLCKSGAKLYDVEEDYTGLGALHPDDPSKLYISTTYDPRDDTFLPKHEIYVGQSADNGQTWSWTPITSNSSRDNLRPVVTYGTDGATALAWIRGSYFSYSDYDAAVVGLVENDNDIINDKIYIDADTFNTVMNDGSKLVFSGPSPDPGTDDDQWHLRTQYGNNSTVFASAEQDSEDSPVILTQTVIGKAGNYNIWVNFWARPNADWRIRAGFDSNQIRIFRHMACKHTDPSEYNSPLLTNLGDSLYLYQAYLGKKQMAGDDTVKVFIDDYPFLIGAAPSLSADSLRTWYDGISYASLDFTSPIPSSTQSNPVSFALGQNYPNPFNPVTTIPFTIPQTAYVKLEIYNPVGQLIKSIINTTLTGGTHHVRWNAGSLPSGLYICRLTFGKNQLSRKILLLK